MGRWRPPQPKSSKYITGEGYKRLNEELKYLWKVKRPEVTQSVKEAAAQGDRSENAEYIYGKKQLREIDRRVRYLSKRLEDMVVVDRAPEPAKRDTVFFGAWVTLLDEDDQKKRHRIVGPDEIDAGSDYIKTSTGKEKISATPEAAYVMCQAIKAYYEKTGIQIGFKPAGGINTVHDAVVYYTIVKEVLGEKWLTNEWLRLGTSRLTNLLLSELVGKEIKYF